MDIQYYVGIAISKTTLDWAVFEGKTIQWQTTTANTVAGLKMALRELKILSNWNPQQAVFCMEHTGIYNAHLLEFLHKAGLSIWVENSSQIKRAGGMQRGKNDVIDVQRIAQYAYGTGHPALPGSDAPMGTTPPAYSTTFFFKCCSSATYSGGTGRPAIISWLDQ